MIGNSRFLILLHVPIQNLASPMFALALRTVTAHWTAAYGVPPP
ncbi:hypothetical protein C4900_00310 [Acidiferrobacter thiooxydans]|uniref:Uncharacterized protein n=1 Tax=Acidiferrobacter thiooxydans TaxID=163359 RepID=A0A368HFW3_9GAMM|nr:hypothetical protein C4900_00310 [Acidiferrobacter thiooxydans]